MSTFSVVDLILWVEADDRWCAHDEMEAKSFNNTMTCYSSLDAIAVTNAYNFAQFKHVCDVGGSHAVMLTKILNKVFP